MADVTIIMVHQVVIVGPRNWFFFDHSMLSVMQQISYNLQIWFHYRLSFTNFFRLICTCAMWKDERRRSFSLAVVYDWWWMKGTLLFAQIFMMLQEKLRGLVLMITVFLLWMTPQFWMSQNLVAIFKIANMHWADGSWLDSLLLEWKNPYLIWSSSHFVF